MEFSKRLSSAKFAIVLVILAEVMIFAGLISAFLIFKYNNTFNWPPADQPRYPFKETALNTFVLIGSGIALWIFRYNWLNGKQIKGLLVTLPVISAVLGSIFISLQGTEWAKLIKFGLTMRSSTYGSIFYAIVGLHAIHVIIGLWWLIISVGQMYKNKFSTELIGPNICGIFWYFVVLIWPLLYIIVYY